MANAISKHDEPIFKHLSKKILDGFETKINQTRDILDNPEKQEDFKKKLALGAAGLVGVGAITGLGIEANQSLTDFNSIDSSDKINNIIDTDNSDNSSSSSSSDNLDNSKKFYNKINEETIIKPKQDNFYNEWLKNHPNDAIRYNGQYLTDLHKDLPWKIDNYADLDAIKKEYSNNSYITNIINEHSKEFEMNVLKEAQARAFDEYMETKATPEEYAKYQNFLKNLGYNSYEDYVKDMNDKDPFFKALRKSNYLTYERWSNLK